MNWRRMVSGRIHLLRLAAIGVFVECRRVTAGCDEIASAAIVGAAGLAARGAAGAGIGRAAGNGGGAIRLGKSRGAAILFKIGMCFD
jgi:hypothetical protein